ncbi:MAG TPA: hypothetical protein VIG64_14105, partial [Actinomycetota bacterium]
ADVGQSAREEINLQPAGEGGQNYGWNRLEGSLAFEGEAPEDPVAPVFEYGREDGGTVIGGYVYRGDALDALRGAYLFGDLFEPGVKALRIVDGDVITRDLGVTLENLVAFGEDTAGELYVLSLAGPVFRIVPTE